MMRMCAPRRAARSAARRSAVSAGLSPSGPRVVSQTRVERHGREAGHVPERRHLLGQQHGVLEPEHAGVARTFEQRRAAAAQVHPERHHHRLAQRVDRRVGHLRESLAEVGVQTLRHRRERRDRSVVAHAPDRIGAGAAHRLEHEPEVLEPVAEAALRPGERLAGVHRWHPRGIGHERRHVAGDPAGVGAASRHLALRIEVPDDLASASIHDQDLARSHLAALDHLARIEVDQADLGARHHEPVAPHLVPRRAEAVPVHRRAAEHAVGEGDGRGAVPRLEHALVVFVERLHRRIEIGILLPRLGHHHHRRVHHVAPRPGQQLHGVVEACGVAALRARSPPAGARSSCPRPATTASAAASSSRSGCPTAC